MKTLLVLAMMVLTAACGRSNTIYHDATDALVGTDGRSDLPTDFANQSVNRASVGVSAAQLTFTVLPGTSDAGSFNSSTETGSRALLGVSKYDASLLSSFSISFSSTDSLRVSLLVDLDCSGGALRTLETSSVSSSVGVSDPVWAVSGAALTSGGVVLVPSESSGSRSTLNDLIAAYPSACLKGGVSDADDLPAGLPVSSLIIGTDISTAALDTRVTSLSINGDVYNTWGAR